MPHQSPPNQASRVGRVVNGEFDAIFEEGVIVWADKAVEAGMRFLGIDGHRLAQLEQAGFKRGVIEKARLTRLEEDFATVDFSGWPIYTQVDASDLLIRKLCEGMEARKNDAVELGSREAEGIAAGGDAGGIHTQRPSTFRFARRPESFGGRRLSK